MKLHDDGIDDAADGPMTTSAYDRAFWEQLWSKTLQAHPDRVAQKPPSAHLVNEASALRPGRALDAGCGHGAEALWLAAHGWRVTGVDFSPSALAQGRSMADTMGADIAERVVFVEGDLGTWTPDPACFELVISLYVHVAGSVEARVRRLASGVAIGGTLLVVGHRPTDPETGAPTAAAGQVQVSVEEAIAALEPGAWDVVVAEERRRPSGGGVDAVVRARRLR